MPSTVPGSISSKRLIAADLRRLLIIPTPTYRDLLAPGDDVLCGTRAPPPTPKPVPIPPKPLYVRRMEKNQQKRRPGAEVSLPRHLNLTGLPPGPQSPHIITDPLLPSTPPWTLHGTPPRPPPPRISEVQRAWEDRFYIREPTDKELDGFFQFIETEGNEKPMEALRPRPKMPDNLTARYEGIRDRDRLAGRLPDGSCFPYNKIYRGQTFYYAVGDVYNPAETHVMPLPPTPLNYGDEAMAESLGGVQEGDTGYRHQIGPTTHNTGVRQSDRLSARLYMEAHDKFCPHSKPEVPRIYIRRDRDDPLEYNELKDWGCCVHITPGCHHHPSSLAIANAPYIGATEYYAIWHGIPPVVPYEQLEVWSSRWTEHTHAYGAPQSEFGYSPSPPPLQNSETAPHSHGIELSRSPISPPPADMEYPQPGYSASSPRSPHPPSTDIAGEDQHSTSAQEPEETQGEAQHGGHLNDEERQGADLRTNAKRPREPEEEEEPADVEFEGRRKRRRENPESDAGTPSLRPHLRRTQRGRRSRRSLVQTPPLISADADVLGYPEDEDGTSQDMPGADVSRKRGRDELEEDDENERPSKVLRKTPPTSTEQAPTRSTSTSSGFNWASPFVLDSLYGAGLSGSIPMFDYHRPLDPPLGPLPPIGPHRRVQIKEGAVGRLSDLKRVE